MKKRNFGEKYLAEIVYGGIDGTITTFAVVAGALGASLSSAVIIILGFANLFADGFSMAASNYLATKSQGEIDIKHKYKNKDLANPNKTALVTFFSFTIIGLIPLISYLLAPLSQIIETNKFTLAIILTGISLLIVGSIKGKVVGKHFLKSAIETLIIGSIAASIAFIVGYLIKSIVG